MHGTDVHETYQHDETRDRDVYLYDRDETETNY